MRVALLLATVLAVLAMMAPVLWNYGGMAWHTQAWTTPVAVVAELDARAPDLGVTGAERIGETSVWKVTYTACQPPLRLHALLDLKNYIHMVGWADPAEYLRIVLHSGVCPVYATLTVGQSASEAQATVDAFEEKYLGLQNASP